MMLKNGVPRVYGTSLFAVVDGKMVTIGTIVSKHHKYIAPMTYHLPKLNAVVKFPMLVRKN